ncbi:unnamed protein product [Timema podura]|uniref:Uncharacterized protein n=1 Tax=Timema podura TaxID=61482 RepID=A0ABN7P4T9_TIMPD|nr:unnamed protein product [Timema podura]
MLPHDKIQDTMDQQSRSKKNLRYGDIISTYLSPFNCAYNPLVRPCYHAPRPDVIRSLLRRTTPPSEEMLPRRR